MVPYMPVIQVAFSQKISIHLLMDSSNSTFTFFLTFFIRTLLSIMNAQNKDSYFCYMYKVCIWVMSLVFKKTHGSVIMITFIQIFNNL